MVDTLDLYSKTIPNLSPFFNPLERRLLRCLLVYIPALHNADTIQLAFNGLNLRNVDVTQVHSGALWRVWSAIVHCVSDVWKAFVRFKSKSDLLTEIKNIKLVEDTGNIMDLDGSSTFRTIFKRLGDVVSRIQDGNEHQRR